MANSSRRRIQRRRKSSKKKRGGNPAILAGAAVGSFVLGSTAGASGMYLYRSRKNASAESVLHPSYDTDPSASARRSVPVPPAAGPASQTPWGKAEHNPSTTTNLIDLFHKVGIEGTKDQILTILRNPDETEQKKICKTINDASKDGTLDDIEATELCNAVNHCYIRGNGTMKTNSSATCEQQALTPGLTLGYKLGGGKKSRRSLRRRKQTPRRRSKRRQSSQKRRR
jgi:hypothetical protein